jgi:lactate dehydrogenase-like 2-hydroxyacid dehydrogenase
MKVFAEHEKIQQFLIANPMDGVEIVDDIKQATFIITGRYNNQKYNPNLKGIIIPYTGHNGIHLDDMREKELMLFITPTRSKYVAEKAVTLTLSLLGRTVQYHNQLKVGNWSSRNSDDRLPWTSIQGLSIGLFGYGRIGKKVHQLLKGFGCDFYTINRHKDYPNDIGLVKNLTNLIQVSDVIIISTPLNPTTEGVFDEEKLSRMKNKFLVNVGRGKICNEKDLYDALVQQNLKGYASDVWYNYPTGKENQLPSSYPIFELDNVVLSNHSGGFTENTNQEVNNDLLKILRKIRDENYEDKLNLKNLL